jgi:hypothetical protein
MGEACSKHRNDGKCKQKGRDYSKDVGVIREDNIRTDLGEIG